MMTLEYEPTPGPWRWEYSATSKSVHLVGGRPMFDKTVMQFARWGMGGAVPLFNAKIAGDQYNVMERLCDMPDWRTPFPGREHHAHWCSNVVHPDAALMAASPLLLDAVLSVLRDVDHGTSGAGEEETIRKCRAAIAAFRNEAVILPIKSGFVR